VTSVNGVLYTVTRFCCSRLTATEITTLFVRQNRVIAGDVLPRAVPRYREMVVGMGVIVARGSKV